MDDTERGRLDSLAAKLGGTRRMLEQAAAMPESQMSPEDREAAAAEAWRKVAEAAQVPADALAGLMGMLEEGATASAVAKRFGVSKWTARKWLENLRDKGAAYVDGERATARWLLAPPLREDDAQ
jgi:response regulator of citrate/malate metabolism